MDDDEQDAVTLALFLSDHAFRLRVLEQLGVLPTNGACCPELPHKHAARKTHATKRCTVCGNQKRLGAFRVGHRNNRAAICQECKEHHRVSKRLVQVREPTF
jgi:hypothetical protein